MYADRLMAQLVAEIERWRLDTTRPLLEEGMGTVERIGAALRRGWDSAALTETETTSTPGSGYMTEERLREEIARLEHRLQEAMERVEAADAAILRGGE